MGKKQLWIGGILLVGLSVWIGLQVGFNRDWIAGIFLFVIPAVVMMSLFVHLAKSKVRHQAGTTEDIQAIRKQLEDLRTQCLDVDQLAKNLNVIETRISLLEKKIAEILTTSQNINTKKEEEPCKSPGK